MGLCKCYVKICNNWQELLYLVQRVETVISLESESFVSFHKITSQEVGIKYWIQNKPAG